MRVKNMIRAKMGMTEGLKLRVDSFWIGLSSIFVEMGFKPSKYTGKGSIK